MVWIVFRPNHFFCNSFYLKTYNHYKPITNNIMETINFEEITLRLEVSSRGGGIEISLNTLGFDGGKMTAYQNYLGGGILGKVCSACNIRDWENNENLTEIADQLRRYYHSLTNPDEDSWEHFPYEKNQNLSESAY